jgi:hypothetical protein
MNPRARKSSLARTQGGRSERTENVREQAGRPRTQPGDALQRPRRRSVYWPQPVEVEAGSDGVPSAVESAAVDAVREEWLVEDRWWTPRPLRRRYFELVLVDGRNVVVFCEPATTNRWFLQRA